MDMSAYWSYLPLIVDVVGINCNANGTAMGTFESCRLTNQTGSITINSCEPSDDKAGMYVKFICKGDDDETTIMRPTTRRWIGSSAASSAMPSYVLPMVAGVLLAAKLV